MPRKGMMMPPMMETRETQEATETKSAAFACPKCGTSLKVEAEQPEPTETGAMEQPGQGDMPEERGIAGKYM